MEGGQEVEVAPSFLSLQKSGREECNSRAGTPPWGTAGQDRHGSYAQTVSSAPAPLGTSPPPPPAGDAEARAAH